MSIHQLWKFHSNVPTEGTFIHITSKEFQHMLWFQDISFGNRSFEDYPQRNNYPPNFIDSCINLFVNTLYTPKVTAHNLPKWNIFVELLFLGRNSFWNRKKPKKIVRSKLTSCNLKIIFTSPVRVKRFFTVKDKLPKMFLSQLVYKYKCGDCKAT